MSETRQTRQITPFNDRILFIPISRMDVVLAVIVAVFIIFTIIDAFSRYEFISAYVVFRHLHGELGYFSLWVAGVLFLMASYIGLIRHADVTDYFRRGTYVTLGTLVIEALVGVILYFVMGARPGDDVHVLYGMGAVLALPFFIFVETTAPKRPAMGSYMWGFGLLAGVLVRCLSTGPVG